MKCKLNKRIYTLIKGRFSFSCCSAPVALENWQICKFIQKFVFNTFSLCGRSFFRSQFQIGVFQSKLYHWIQFRKKLQNMAPMHSNRIFLLYIVTKLHFRNFLSRKNFINVSPSFAKFFATHFYTLAFSNLAFLLCF